MCALSSLSVDAKPAKDPRPTPPEKPDPDECCGSGCVQCVLDLYEDELSRYEEALAAWQTRHVKHQR
jgi:hypothetical protein